MLLVTAAFGNVNAVKEDVPSFENMTMDEIITMYDPNCQNMTDEEIAKYIEDVGIKSRPPRFLDFDDEIESKILDPLQEPVNPGDRILTYGPPWGVYDIEYDEYEFGIASAGWEGSVDPYQGWCNIVAAAGPGLGEAWGTVWITHGIYFRAPVTDTYTITLDYKIQGWVKGGITWIDAVASSQVVLFFMVADITEQHDTLYEQTIPIIYQQYEKYFDENEDTTMQVQLYEGNYYYIVAQAAEKGRAVAALADFGYSFNHLDDEDVSGWGDGAILNLITIDWPNHIPEQPSKPDGPSQGITGEEYTFTTSATDPDGIGDSLWYKWFWGDGTESEWIGPYESGEECSASHSWAEKGTYQIRVYAKDRDDAVSPLSDPKSIIISELPNNPPEPPTTRGPTRGKPGMEYEYTFVTTDPDGDGIRYYIEWGDGESTGEGPGSNPHESGEEITRSHTYNSKGKYTIRARATDVHGAESDWGTLDVSMPRSQQSTTLLFIQFIQKLIQRFPILEQILSSSPLYSRMLNL